MRPQSGRIAPQGSVSKTLATQLALLIFFVIRVPFRSDLTGARVRSATANWQHTLQPTARRCRIPVGSCAEKLYRTAVQLYPVRVLYCSIDYRVEPTLPIEG